MKVEKLGKMRLYTVNNGKIEYIYKDEMDIQTLGSPSQEIYVEEIPEDQIDAQIQELIQIIHFRNDISNYHSVPFLFKLNEVNYYIL